MTFQSKEGKTLMKCDLETTLEAFSRLDDAARIKALEDFIKELNRELWVSRRATV